MISSASRAQRSGGAADDGRAAVAASPSALSETTRRRLMAEAAVELQVEHATGAAIAAGRDGNPLRRRYLDRTAAGASPLAIAAGLGWL